jgi:hypothetical protein
VLLTYYYKEVHVSFINFLRQINNYFDIASALNFYCSDTRASVQVFISKIDFGFYSIVAYIDSCCQILSPVTTRDTGNILYQGDTVSLL